MDGKNVKMEPSVEEKDQFALEMDHMSECVQKGKDVHTPGEEGLQDQRIVEAIYEAAKTGKAVKLSAPSTSTRGPEPSEES
jgi:predicted dehydrogenase